ncbi:copper-binding transcription factor [Vanrija albida]|uniref:Copper-binding transcription factor n=1 Tax=Vanrija albida TaxID=181172 RepID=A0ABR3QEE0_9TREE
MVLINDKKYACATCIKGHRVSGCTHTDRPLFEVKKKGRPATQCQFCRDKRKGAGSACASNGSGGSVHTKCSCGDLKNQAPSTILPGNAAPTIVASVQPPAPAPLIVPEVVETKKGVPGSTPTFPNGLKDVHDMAAAAEALTGLSGDSSRAAERKLQNLLNPCHCQTTGLCKCCAPKRPTPAERPERSPPPRIDTHAQVTDSLIEMFKSKATTTTPSEGGASTSGSTTPNQAATMQPFSSLVRANLSMTTANLSSPDNRHHPAHTSPHVHKTRLYSPYSTNGHSSPRHGKTRSESGSSASGLSPVSWTNGQSIRPPPPRLRPLTDLNRLLGAAFNQDGSIAAEIPRSALGLPGIHAFDAAAQQGGMKVEPMEMEVDGPLAFPTSEDVTISGCTCGDGCECPGCALHGNPPAPGASSTDDHHGHDGACGPNCPSRFDCHNHVSIPSGVQSVEQLIKVAAANVPPPRAQRATDLNPHDTAVLPPAAQMGEDAARAFGLVQLLPLECCNGRCQCPPGACSCESSCCGCCVRCACDEDGDTHMHDAAEPPTAPAAGGGCCGGGSTATASATTASSANGLLQPSPQSSSPLVLTPASAHRQASPQPSTSAIPKSTSTPPNGVAIGAPAGGPVRRTTSVHRAKEASNGTTGRRTSVSSVGGASVQRSSSLGSKSSAKALALHTNPHHPRPILPKPSAGARLAPPRSTSGSGSGRQLSPTAQPPSSQGSRSGSPSAPGAAAPQEAPPDRDDVAVTDRGMAVGVDDIASALAASEVDFMAFFNQLLSAGANDGASDASGLSSMTGPPEINVQGVDADGVPNPAMFNVGDYGASMGDIQELIAGALAQQGVIDAPEASAQQQQVAAQQQQQAAQAAQAQAQVAQQQAAQQQQLQPPQPQPQASPNADIPPNFNYFFNIPTMQNNLPPRAQSLSATEMNAAEASTKAFFPFGQDAQLAGMVGFHPGVQQPPLPNQAAGNDAFYPAFGNNFAAQPMGLGAENNAPSRGSISSASEAPPAMLPSDAAGVAAPQLQAQLAAAASGAVNPDIIDLSKPLNPSDVDRILQALLNQQARQGTVAAAAPVPVAAAPTQPPLLRSHPSTESSVSQTHMLANATASLSVGDPFDEFLFDPSQMPAMDTDSPAAGAGAGQNAAASGAVQWPNMLPPFQA